MVVKAVNRCDAGLFGISWFTGTYLIWIPVSIITDRVTYLYYFYPTVGSICIGLGLVIGRLIEFWKTRRMSKLKWMLMVLVGGYLIFHIMVFVWLSPILYWW
jgi:dolichyl-phosphate-mannose--protein O-mannosyl transferase